MTREPTKQEIELIRVALPASTVQQIADRTGLSAHMVKDIKTWINKNPDAAGGIITPAKIGPASHRKEARHRWVSLETLDEQTDGFNSHIGSLNTKAEVLRNQLMITIAQNGLNPRARLPLIKARDHIDKAVDCIFEALKLVA